jgi:hypothetical protein
VPLLPGCRAANGGRALRCDDDHALPRHEIESYSAADAAWLRRAGNIDYRCQVRDDCSACRCADEVGGGCIDGRNRRQADPVKLNPPVLPVVAVRFDPPVSVTVAPLIGVLPLATVPVSSPTLTFREEVIGSLGDRS